MQERKYLMYFAVKYIITLSLVAVSKARVSYSNVICMESRLTPSQLIFLTKLSERTKLDMHNIGTMTTLSILFILATPYIYL